MESWPPRPRARPGPLPAPGLLGLILLPWTLPLAGAGTRSSPPPELSASRTSQPLSSAARLIPRTRLRGFAGCV